MTQESGGKQQSVFSRWLRTGRRPVVRATGVIELKFNPWHDPADGRFTFAGSGNYHGNGAPEAGRPVAIPVRRSTPPKPHVPLRPGALALRRGPPANANRAPVERGAAPAGSQPPAASRPSDQPNAATEFVGGVGEGLYGVARGTVAAAHSALTTNPVTTVRNAGRGVAATIDSMIAAEDTPATTQFSRAADAIAKASPREIGRATGSVLGNTALAVAPGAAVRDISILRGAREAALRPTYEPPQIGWVKENLSPGKPSTIYNDAAPGARAGQAPTLMRTMPDGSKRPVKFDGVEGDYLVDRKWAVVNTSKGRGQLLRQSDVLAQHRAMGTWEVPDQRQKIKALKMLKRMNVANIRIRIVKP